MSDKVKQYIYNELSLNYNLIQEYLQKLNPSLEYIKNAGQNYNKNVFAFLLGKESLKNSTDTFCYFVNNNEVDDDFSLKIINFFVWNKIRINVNDPRIIDFFIQICCATDNIMIFNYLNYCGFNVNKVVDYNNEEEGITVKQATISGIALFFACSNNAIEITKLLVENFGANINVIEESKMCTPLVYASCFSSLELIKYLVDKGAKIDIKDKDGCTAIDYAIKEKREEVVKYLIKEQYQISLDKLNIEQTIKFYKCIKDEEQLVNTLTELKRQEINFIGDDEKWYKIQESIDATKHLIQNIRDLKLSIYSGKQIVRKPIKQKETQNYYNYEQIYNEISSDIGQNDRLKEEKEELRKLDELYKDLPNGKILFSVFDIY